MEHKHGCSLLARYPSCHWPRQADDSVSPQSVMRRRPWIAVGFLLSLPGVCPRRWFAVRACCLGREPWREFRDVMKERGRSKWFSETLYGVIGDADATKH